jgi:hypothetical protein
MSRKNRVLVFLAMTAVVFGTSFAANADDKPTSYDFTLKPTEYQVVDEAGNPIENATVGRVITYEELNRHFGFHGDMPSLIPFYKSWDVQTLDAEYGLTDAHGVFKLSHEGNFHFEEGTLDSPRRGVSATMGVGFVDGQPGASLYRNTPYVKIDGFEECPLRQTSYLKISPSWKSAAEKAIESLPASEKVTITGRNDKKPDEKISYKDALEKWKADCSKAEELKKD